MQLLSSHPHTSHTPSDFDSEEYPQLDIDNVLKIDKNQRENSLRVSTCYGDKCFDKSGYCTPGRANSQFSFDNPRMQVLGSINDIVTELA